MQRLLLRLDGAGCVGGAVAALFMPSLWSSWLAMPSSWRIPFSVSLMIFGVLLLIFAQSRGPLAPRLRIAAGLNAVWVAAAVMGLPWLHSPAAITAALIIAVLDAFLGVLQWRIARRP